jgi:hypothetical protein
MRTKVSTLNRNKSNIALTSTVNIAQTRQTRVGGQKNHLMLRDAYSDACKNVCTDKGNYLPSFKCGKIRLSSDKILLQEFDFLLCDMFKRG